MMIERAKRPAMIQQADELGSQQVSRAVKLRVDQLHLVADREPDGVSQAVTLKVNGLCARRRRVLGVVPRLRGFFFWRSYETSFLDYAMDDGALALQGALPLSCFKRLGADWKIAAKDATGMKAAVAT